MILVTITSYVPFLCSVFPQPQASVYFIHLPSTLLEVIFQFLNLQDVGLGAHMDALVSFPGLLATLSMGTRLVHTTNMTLCQSTSIYYSRYMIFWFLFLAVYRCEIPLSDLHCSQIRLMYRWMI